MSPLQLHMLRVSPSMGQMVEMNTTLRHLLFLLEYCMVTGYDWWDVLLHVQPTMVHNLVERLHEEYMRQNQALQQVRRSPQSRGRGLVGGQPGDQVVLEGTFFLRGSRLHWLTSVWFTTVR